MADRRGSLADILGGDLPGRWKEGQTRLSQFLSSVGLTGDEYSRALYIFPKTPLDPIQYLGELHTQIDEKEQWVFLTGNGGTKVIAFPVNKNVHIGAGSPKALIASFIEVHSRLVSWWLVNAWRSRQLADATWYLGDSMQIIPAAACARSLLETAASFWIETKNLREKWGETKRDYAVNGPNIEHWYNLTHELYKMVWGAKFDKKVPDLEKSYGSFSRSNVLTQIDKLARTTDYPVQEDYQWLCNAVHPSVGGMLAFATPMMVHASKACAFQWVCAVPTSVRSAKLARDKYSRADFLGGKDVIEAVGPSFVKERTVQEALARAAILAVDVLQKTLDDALRIIDDIGLTTKAPTMADFEYWRNLVHKKGNALCPCRSGQKAKHCFHRWTDPTPAVVDRFHIAS